ATFQASLRALADTRIPLRALASELNQWCWDRSLEGRHFTMAFLADLDPQTGSLAYVSAGHQSPVIARGNGNIERLEVAGFPLGAFASSEYEVGRTVLEAEDTLVVFTDGVVNAVNNSQELFTEARIIRALNDSRGFTANEILNHLAMRVLSFCGSRKQEDDFTFVIVRRRSGGNGTRCRSRTGQSWRVPPPGSGRRAGGLKLGLAALSAASGPSRSAAPTAPRASRTRSAGRPPRRRRAGAGSRRPRAPSRRA